MDVLVVKDTSIGAALYKRDVACWPLDQIPPFQTTSAAREGRRDRSEAERLRAELPLPPLSPNIAGHPKYLVNLIQLTEENEHLRDTVFWNIFKSALVFDDFESAVAFKRAQKKPLNSGFTTSKILTI